MTRVERQLRTGRIPLALRTLEKLSQNATNFNPFSSVEFLAAGNPELNIKDYPPGRYLEGTGLRHFIQGKGAAQAWNILNESSQGNARRIIRRLKEFLPPDPEGYQVPDLFALYLGSLRYQLLGHTRSASEPAKGRDEFQPFKQTLVSV